MFLIFGTCPPGAGISGLALKKALILNFQKEPSVIAMHPINKIQTAIEPLRQALLHHPVYGQIQSVPDLHVLMENQIFAAWDYMSLLKALQRELTCVEVPWVPKGSPVLRRLINEMVLAVETDVDQEGLPASHYELYLDAMEDTGADTSAIKDLVREISFGKTVEAALATLAIPDVVKQLVQFSFDTIARSKVHEIASLLTFGRCDLTPDRFCDLVEEMDERDSNQLSLLCYYLNRHREVEAGRHGPMSMQMLVELCGEDESKWEECLAAATRGLEHQLAMWDAIAAGISQFTPPSFLRNS
jgi:hypothetical protein